MDKREYMKAYKKERYELLKRLGICVECGLEDVWENKTKCLQCLFRTKERSEATRSEESKIQRKKYLARKRDLCIAFGLCRECLKREVIEGKKRCVRCTNNQKVRYANKTPLKRQDRTRLGMCYFCGEKAVEGKKTCKTHFTIMSNNLKCWERNNQDHPWRKEDRRFVQMTQKWKRENGIIFLEKDIKNQTV